MSRLDQLHPDGTSFDRFLHADLGDDWAGNRVTVLSALARLDLDPWDEAAALAGLPRAAARQRLEGHLARFHDVPALGRHPGADLPHLLDLLPQPARAQSFSTPALPAGMPRLGYGQIAVILLVILFVVRALFTGSGGTDD